MVAGVPNDGNGGAGHSLRSDMNWDSMVQMFLSIGRKSVYSVTTTSL